MVNAKKDNLKKLKAEGKQEEYDKSRTLVDILLKEQLEKEDAEDRLSD